ncbi:hypothetical protein [Streptomyces sp. NPDC008122]|uniref:hypothetical protein n=1 Tax=Streptomyces sp. NPDC008122 TaxID=3364810 RepID=UPI0036ECF9A4
MDGPLVAFGTGVPMSTVPAAQFRFRQWPAFALASPGTLPLVPVVAFLPLERP